MSKLSVAVLNHGCKLNQFEGEALSQSFRDAGFRVVQWSERALPDIVIVNTCTVTEKSDRKSRHSILKAGRYKRTGDLLIVTGCYAETAPEELSGIGGVDFVVGVENKPRIVEIVQAHLAERSVRFDSPASQFSYPDPEQRTRSRAVVKVQDGCDMRCAYCKVPLARGGSVSRKSGDVLDSIAGMVENGFREVVLTGINLGDYRDGAKRLSDLMRLILERNRGLRIRLSSIEPAFFENGLFDVIGNERVAPHFHIPLQSGSDRILGKMNRPYRLSEYMDLIESVRKIRPESHIATDLIVGFPSESEQDFKGTLDTVRSVGFASLHVFKYSVRTGTNGSRMHDDVPYEAKRKRSKQLIELGRRLNSEYRDSFIGTRRNAVLEVSEGALKGVTDNYIRVTIENASFEKKGFARKLVPVLITRTEGEVTWATIS